MLATVKGRERQLVWGGEQPVGIRVGTVTLLSSGTRDPGVISRALFISWSIPVCVICELGILHMKL